MKKAIFCFCVLVASLAVNAQDVKHSFGVGFQTSFPIYGISAKYALNEHSVVQATIAPFSGGAAKINFYGGRYIYRFSNENSNNLEPYVFGGAGLITFSLENSGSNFFSYSAGGGAEYIVGGALGLSADLGYGKLNVTNDAAVSGIFLGLGLHYYIQ